MGLLSAGCGPDTQTGRARQLYDEGSRLYLAQRYAQAVGPLADAGAASGDVRLLARASLLQGRSYLAMRQFHQAEAAFRRGVGLAKVPAEVGAGLKLGLADSLYGQERYQEAARQYRELLRRYGDHIPADEATFKLALACQRGGLWQEAHQHFARLASEFPQSPRAQAARRFAADTRRTFTVQCGAFSSDQAARRLANELRRKGFEPRLVPITTSDSGQLVAVQVGSFKTWAEARRLRSLVLAAGFEARIVP